MTFFRNLFLLKIKTIFFSLLTILQAMAPISICHGLLKYKIVFLGDASLISEVLGNVESKFVENVKGSSIGNSVQLVIQNQPSQLVTLSPLNTANVNLSLIFVLFSN